MTTSLTSLTTLWSPVGLICLGRGPLEPKIKVRRAPCPGNDFLCATLVVLCFQLSRLTMMTDSQTTLQGNGGPRRTKNACWRIHASRRLWPLSGGSLRPALQLQPVWALRSSRKILRAPDAQDPETSAPVSVLGGSGSPSVPGSSASGEQITRRCGLPRREDRARPAFGPNCESPVWV